MTIEVDIDIRSKEDTTTQEQAVKSLAKSLSGVKSDSSNEAKNLKRISLGGDTLVLEKVETVGSVNALCADGQVFGTVKNQANISKKTCSKNFHYLYSFT